MLRYPFNYDMRGLDEIMFSTQDGDKIEDLIRETLI